MNEHLFDPATPAPNKERPFLPRINDGGILGRLGESEVARLRQQLEMECIAMQQGLTGYAVTARHEIIQRRYEAVGHCQKQLEQLVGKEEAALITAETYVKVIG